MMRTKYSDARMIIPEEFWSILDKDGNGVLSDGEFHRAVHAFDLGIIYGTPWLIYEIEETKNLKEFRVTYASDVDAKKALFAVVPMQSSVMPYSREAWQKWYDGMSRDYGLSFAPVVDASEKSLKSSLISLQVDKLPETAKFAMPLATLSNAKIELKSHINLSERVLFSDSTHGIARKMFTDSVEIRATKQLPDVVHVFNNDQAAAATLDTPDLSSKSSDTTDTSESASLGAKGKVSSASSNYACSPTPTIAHASVGSCAITDDTVMPVTVMIRFPGSRTQDYVCGLPFANVYTTELDANGNIKDSQAKATAYIADDLGRMYLAFTPGTSWKIEVDYETHILCYGGDDLSSDSCHQNGNGETKPSFNLMKVQGGETVIFLDQTERWVDIGLYAGACDTPYEGYELMITPANGCGSSITVSDTNINTDAAWSTTKVITTVDDPTKPKKLRKWPYAAMDYYIQLETAPDVSSLTQDKIKLDKTDNTGVTCKPPGSSIMEFFRERNMLVQTLMLLKTTDTLEGVDVKYLYHGWFCATPSFSDQASSSSYAPFTEIGPNNKCIGDASDTLPLTKKHLIGKSTNDFTINSEAKYVRMKIFEAHLIRKDTIEYCSVFQSSDNSRLGVEVQIKQDIGPQATNKCHSKNEPSDTCKFTNVDADGLLKFTSTDSYYTVSSLDAEPNLVPPYRRTFLARINRNDGWSVANLEVKRELVTIASKTRGGGDLTQRYNSGSKFYATAPIKGLVYTCVHDPPGGSSYASIAQGTNIQMEVGLALSRSSTSSFSQSNGGGGGSSISINVKPNLGTAYVNAEVEINVDAADLGEAPFHEGKDDSAWQNYGENPNRRRRRQLMAKPIPAKPIHSTFLKKGTGQHGKPGKKYNPRAEMEGKGKSTQVSGVGGGGGSGGGGGGGWMRSSITGCHGGAALTICAAV